MSSIHLCRMFGTKLGFATAITMATATWAWGQQGEAAMSGVSAAHPDSDMEVQARWNQLTMLSLRHGEISTRDAAVPRKELESVQLAANGWGIIVNPKGAVALVRRTEDGKKPLTFFAPEGTIDVKKLCAAMVELSQAKAKEGAPYLGGFKLKGETQVSFARIYDPKVWNAVVNAAVERLEAAARGQFASATEQFPLRIEPAVAAEK